MKSDITSFWGEYRFLSNFYMRPFEFRGLVWPSSEHAYQAMKSSDPKVWNEFANGSWTAGEAKRLGGTIQMRPDWNAVRINFMRAIVHEKFNQNSDLMERLLATHGQQLIEGNHWGDRFWGECPLGTGRNELGKILMAIRDSKYAFG